MIPNLPTKINSPDKLKRDSVSSLLKSTKEESQKDSMKNSSTIKEENSTPSHLGTCKTGSVYYEACEDSFEIEQKANPDFEWEKDATYIRKHTHHKNKSKDLNLQLSNLQISNYSSFSKDQTEIGKINDNSNTKLNEKGIPNINQQIIETEYEDCMSDLKEEKSDEKSEVSESINSSNIGNSRNILLKEIDKGLNLKENKIESEENESKSNDDSKSNSDGHSKSNSNSESNSNSNSESNSESKSSEKNSESESCVMKKQIKFNFDRNIINMEFFNTNLRVIPIKNKGFNATSAGRHFKTLIELQNFEVEQSPIWSIKISPDAKYLATAGASGEIKIFSLLNFDYDEFQDEYSTENILNYLKFIKEEPTFVMTEHKADVLEIEFSPYFPNIFASASLDCTVILWDLNSPEKNFILKKWEHNDLVTSLAFSPTDPDLFVSGCLDKYVRLFSIKKGDFEYFNIKEKITSISFLPSGKTLAIGCHNGKVIVYNILPRMNYYCSFTVKNKIGKNFRGKKVTFIEFINKNNAIITTADSIIRQISFPEGKLISKFKGHVNEQFMLKATCEHLNDLIISGSENGNCYIWGMKNEENRDKKKGNAYEYFRPFEKDFAICSIFLNEVCYNKFIAKIYYLTNQIFIHSVIVNATDQGRIQVLLNVEST
ncbi:MAG: hypothetical protein MJ252_19915 [archaeon]|nr:hypothetical protein [archaeon]